MAVLIYDAKSQLRTQVGHVEADELLYADDTLLMDRSGGHAQAYMQCVHELGMEYGLSFNWGKLEVMTVGCADVIAKPDGSPVKHKQSMVYLGSLLSEDGYIDAELGRRIGAARADFDALSRVWRHAKVLRSDKVRIFDACVMSKFMYALHTAWLNAAARRRLDGFQARCLRAILSIQHSMHSRVSNTSFLAQAGAMKASVLLLQRQLDLFGRVATCTEAAPLRQSVMNPGATTL